jgi:hypothetical protein
MFWKCKTYGACTAADIVKGISLGSKSAAVSERLNQHSSLILQHTSTSDCRALLLSKSHEQLTELPQEEVCGRPVAHVCERALPVCCKHFS